MNISVCITVKNEEASIGSLLESLVDQTKKPSEIIIVDGGSSDKTVEIINHYQKRFSGIRLLKEICTRAKGRNLGVDVAKNEIVAMTDAGCIARPDWLEKITGPFCNKEVDVTAGFYDMVTKNEMQKAMGLFLGISPEKYDISFLPSTRSIAFRKEVWEKVGGFPENLNVGEDTVFNYRLLKNNTNFSRVKDAVVGWGIPESIKEFSQKLYVYARGDALTKIWLFPSKGIMSHNIKAIFIILRYLTGFILLIMSFWLPHLFVYLAICILAYLLFAFKKAKFWGIVLQFVSDFSVMSGFVSGIIR